MINETRSTNGGVAQWVGRLTRNAEVGMFEHHQRPPLFHWAR